jgi:sialate O-acetylesterase
MKSFQSLLLSTLICLVGGVTQAQSVKPLLHPLFADHAVLQRDTKVPVWGWTAPGGKVVVSFAGQNKQATADGHGKWTATLDPMPASSEGRTLEVKSGQAVIINDVLVGDVWICSGQSNMEMGIKLCEEDEEITGADFPNIRLLTVPRRIAFTPQATMDGRWLPCSPQHIIQGAWGGFSAAAYFFGKELHRELGIPIGLIHASWGGTPCEAWISSGALASQSLCQKELARVSHVASLPGPHKLDDYMDQWYRENDPGSRSGWCKPETDASTWKTATMPAAWKDSGLPGAYEGIVWLRRSFDIPATWHGKELILGLGTIADLDTTWINGQIVGRCDSYEQTRSYSVPAAVLRPGRNEIAIRVMNAGGGGLSGKPEELKIQPLDHKEAPVSLAGTWQLKASATRRQTGAPLAGNPGTPSVLYNGMIAPLLPYAAQGAIWYQGEANTADPTGYRTSLPTLIRDWRTRFNSEHFAFHIVSLANYQPQAADQDWPALREAQAMTAKQVPHCGHVVTIDIGDAKDIHPKNKREVGRRLALSALANTHRRDIAWSGPWYRSMESTDQGIRLAFDHTHGALMAKGGQATGFTIAGEDRKFVTATAIIDGDTVLVSSPMVEKPIAVRYAWSANPACDLHNKAKLPAVPFRTDDWQLEQPSAREEHRAR